MMASSAETPKNIELGKVYLAFALALLKQKPADCSTKDYILKAREFIRKQNSISISNSTKLFDSAAFWKAAYEKSEEDQVKLHNTIFELEQRIRGRQPSTKATRIKTSHENLKKRKTPLRELSANIEPSRRKRSQLRKLEMKDIESVEDDDENEAPKLAKELFVLRRILQKKTPSDKIATEAVIMCKVAETELLGAVKSLPSKLNSSDALAKRRESLLEILTIIHSTELGVSLVYQALAKVAKAVNDSLSKGRIIYYTICLYESILTGMSLICNTAPKENEVIKKLSDLLYKMASSLDMARAEDQEILEGFLFITLERLGKMLALFTFKNHQLPSPAELAPPEGLKDAKKELSPKTAQPEAKCLILVLRKVLGTQPLDSNNEKKNIIHGMKERLQKTLVQAVFGSDDPLLRGGLARPSTPPSVNCKTTSAPRSDFTEWFTSELWDLVGWDVLSQISHVGQGEGSVGS